MESCDFLDLLKERELLPAAPTIAAEASLQPVEGTTIVAVRCADGVVVAGDRRATMGNLVVYDRADKVLIIDDEAVMAIAGSPAVAWDIARMLEMSVQYYRRSQLQGLSLDGKVRTLSRLLRQNLPLAMQGIGAVVPIFAAFDHAAAEGKIFFYDLLGAEFECVDFCATGSGAHLCAVRCTTKTAGGHSRCGTWPGNRPSSWCSRCWRQPLNTTLLPAASARPRTSFPK